MSGLLKFSWYDKYELHIPCSLYKILDPKSSISFPQTLYCTVLAELRVNQFQLALFPHLSIWTDLNRVV